MSKIEENEKLREALTELVDLMQGVIDGDYKPDSFTLQPARAALTAGDAALRAIRQPLEGKS